MPSMAIDLLIVFPFLSSQYLPRALVITVQFSISLRSVLIKKQIFVCGGQRTTLWSWSFLPRFCGLQELNSGYWDFIFPAPVVFP